jgi:putative PIG3 family NAD(P)H quinone oxidoreductase
MAGVVEKVGSAVIQWSPGDRVCALLPGGGYAARVKVPGNLAIRIPDDFSFEEATAIPEVFLTAYFNIFMLGGLQPGKIVLIHAAGGGVGLAGIQLVKQFGAKVIATVRTQEKADACLKFGADLAINTNTDDFAQQVNRFTGGKGVNVILDPVGSSYFDQNLQCLATEGKLIIIGLLAGHSVPHLDLRELLLRRWQLIGSTLRALPVARKTDIVLGFLKQFMPMFIDGRIKPTIDSVYDVADINDAHMRMEKNLNIGKIVVCLNF